MLKRVPFSCTVCNKMHRLALLSLYLLLCAQLPSVATAGRDMNKVAADLEKKRRSLHSDGIRNTINAKQAGHTTAKENPDAETATTIDSTDSTDETHKLEVDGESVGLSDLGPIIINPDGSARRITNWAVLSAGEKEVAWRRVRLRNARRMKTLVDLLQQPGYAEKEVTGGERQGEDYDRNLDGPLAALPGLHGDGTGSGSGDAAASPPAPENAEAEAEAEAGVSKAGAGAGAGSPSSPEKQAHLSPQQQIAKLRRQAEKESRREAANPKRRSMYK